jgi:hypothetical protein
MPRLSRPSLPKSALRSKSSNKLLLIADYVINPPCGRKLAGWVFTYANLRKARRENTVFPIGDGATVNHNNSVNITNFQEDY